MQLIMKVCITKGTRSIELESVIDFLYNGEAYVDQEQLRKFLETAQELQVKGLQSNLEDEREIQPERGQG